ncbi:MAG: hypothetical protein RLZZ15_15 [Verrucomicrobiota bacterium]
MPATFDTPPSLTRREALQRAALFLGAALSPSLLSGVLAAQPANAAASSSAAAAPRYLTAAQFAAAAAAAERILPRTDTPGALDVGVPAFIDLMFGRFLSAEEKSRLTGGLAALDAASATAHRQPFAQLAGAQQDALLQAAADAANGDLKTFFYQIKELTIVGYFTSEPVGKNVTRYEPVPGPFRACVPITETGNRAWTK